GGAVEAALHGLEHEPGGPRSTRGRGHDVHGRGAGPPQVLVHQVQQVLVVGVGVHRGHETLLDAEGVVEDLDHGYEAVGRAGGVGHDLVLSGVEGVVVDAHDEGGVR